LNNCGITLELAGQRPYNYIESHLEPKAAMRRSTLIRTGEDEMYTDLVSLYKELEDRLDTKLLSMSRVIEKDLRLK
jgi:hypothetical protein